MKEKALAQNFWPEFYERADTQAEPPAEAFSEMLESLCTPVALYNAQFWFSQSLTGRHRYDDTHPALGDRLEAMGFTNVRQESDVRAFLVESNSARSDDYFLAQAPHDFIAASNRLWKEQLARKWSERYQFVVTAAQSLTELAEKAATTNLTVDELWQRARFTAGTDGNTAAIPLLKDVLAVKSDHVYANYLLGEALIEQGDEAGIEHIKVAMEKDVHAIPTGCETIALFLEQRERAWEARRYRECIDGYRDEEQRAEYERTRVTKRDNFEPHALTPESLEPFQAQLANFPNLVSAYLVRKEVQHFPDHPMYVLGVIAKHRWYGISNNRLDAELVNELATKVSSPGRTLVLAMEQNFKWLRKRLRRVEGSEIYRAR